MLWLQENRPNLKKKYPGASVTELAKRAGEVWKGISDKSVSTAKIVFPDAAILLYRNGKQMLGVLRLDT